ncbi:hypothetical protein [Neptuniibacter halophilus]|uniref:hypothetical protein n=1 Tax=Neptuniibacter halophilus TaxID=651666 RepID=UPI0025738380|nr:hypothetical protein [Neptuniibacter halophilus]
MAQFHQAKEKSQWVSDAVLDLLSREIYEDADWQDADHEDTVAFLSLLNFDEKLIDPVADTILMPQSVVDSMSEAVKKICWVLPEASRSVRPAIIRAAIRQRVLLNGKLLSEVLL